MTGTRISNSAIVVLLNRFVLMAVSLLTMSGCDRFNPAVIAGTYTRTVPGLSETLLVNADGTFEQTVKFADGEVFSVKDSWTNQYRQVSFKRLYVVFDVETKTTINPPELRYMVNLQCGQDVLVKNAESGYLFRKQAESNAQ